MYDIVYVKPRAETLRIHSSFLEIGYQMQMEEYQMHPLLNTKFPGWVRKRKFSKNHAMQ